MKLVARTNNAVIVASIDKVSRDAHIHTEHPVDDRQYDQPIRYTGHTTVQHDTTEPLTVYGESVYLDAEGRTYLAGDLEIHHDGGLEEEYEGHVEPRPAPLTGQAARRLAALKYANWLVHSDHDLDNGEMDEHTHARVQRRAREHARAAGVEEMLDTILAATSQEPGAS